jgi:hypothetical protein
MTGEVAGRHHQDVYTPNSSMTYMIPGGETNLYDAKIIQIDLISIGREVYLFAHMYRIRLTSHPRREVVPISRDVSTHSTKRVSLPIQGEKAPS